MYHVLRHGGNYNHAWRTVFKSEHYEKAKEKFDKIKINLRQGGIKLLHNEQLLEEEYTYRTRTIW